MNDNPYEAPAARVDEAPGAVVDAEAQRSAHLRREAGLRAIGVLCLVFAAFFLTMGAAMGATWVENPEAEAGIGWMMFGVFMGMAVLALATAWGYVGLRPWVKVPAVVLALVTLLVSAFLTAPIVGYAAWLTFSGKGWRVLSWDYTAIRRATPHLSAWRWPREALLLLGLLGIYLALLVFAAANMPKGPD